MTYCDRYKKIREETIFVVNTLIKRYKYFRRTESKKLILLKIVLGRLNDIYKTKTKLKTTKIKTDGYYNLLDKTIYLNKLSLVTFLHEFKHSLQHQKGKKNNEEIARGWSVSLFKLASPRHYERAVKKKLLLYE